jgi:hypothetical protein
MWTEIMLYKFGVLGSSDAVVIYVEARCERYRKLLVAQP